MNIATVYARTIQEKASFLTVLIQHELPHKFVPPPWEVVSPQNVGGGGSSGGPVWPKLSSVFSCKCPVGKSSQGGGVRNSFPTEVGTL